MNSFSMETLLQDPGNSTPGTWESYLYNKAKDLENLQYKLYQGKFGLLSETKMRYLDKYLITFGCKLDGYCDSVEEDTNINYTKHLLKLGINEIIDDMILSGISIANLADIDRMKFTNSVQKINGETFLNNCLGNPDYFFQYKMLDYIIPTVLGLEGILSNNIKESIRSTLYDVMLAASLGLFLFILSLVITYKIIKATNKTINELVNVVFLLPQTTVNMTPPLKRFIETGNFEE